MIYQCNIHYTLLISGGLGGLPGFFKLIKLENTTFNAQNLRKFKGANGRNGANGRVCSSYTLDVYTTLWFTIKLAGTLDLSTDFTTKSITNPNCLTPQFVYSNEEPLQPSPIITHLDIASGIIEYKRFLLEKITNPTFTEIIQKTCEAIAINSDPEINY